MDKMRELFESRFQDLPMDGVFWSDDTGCYTTKDELLIPDVDFCNDMLDSFKDGYEAAQPKWISVESGELPEKDTKVLAISLHGHKNTPWFNGDSFGDSRGIMINVTHWMPLPDDPNE